MDKGIDFNALDFERKGNIMNVKCENPYVLLESTIGYFIIIKTLNNCNLNISRMELGTV